MRPVTEEELKRVWREYLQERVDQLGGGRGFEKATGLSHGNVARVLRGGSNVTEKMIAAIARTIGPTVPEIYAIIGLRCANESPKGSIVGYARINATTLVKAEHAEKARAAIAEAAKDLGKAPEVHEPPAEQPRKARVARRRRSTEDS